MDARERTSPEYKAWRTGMTALLLEVDVSIQSEILAMGEAAIRQAEQFARERALEDAAQRIEKIDTLRFWDQLRWKMEDAGPSVVQAIRALKEKP